mgnify:CR=1 FL=1
MNHGDVGCDVLHFIGLQVADEMPLNIGGQGSLLLAQFLFLTSPKMRCPVSYAARIASFG